VILVGHSRGGTVISEAAERAPDSIRTLVYLAAFLLPSGLTLAEAAARVPRVQRGNILAPGPDGSSIVQPQAIGPTFYNMTPPEWVARAIERLTPEPAKGMATAVNITQGAFGRVPRAYIECAQDNAVPLELQRAMQAELPCDPVFTLETDHSPFYSAPELLVATLEKLAACN
jgi:pimeloyl-ACP methyl ester carboxylesterase